MLVRPQATERRVRTECALELHKIVSGMMKEAGILTRASAHLLNHDKRRCPALGILRRHADLFGNFCIEDVDRIARKLERGQAPKPGKKRLRPNNQDGSVEVVALHPGGASMTSPPIYENDLTPDERKLLSLYRQMSKSDRAAFLRIGKVLAKSPVNPDRPGEGPIAG